MQHLFEIAYFNVRACDSALSFERRVVEQQILGNNLGMFLLYVS